MAKRVECPGKVLAKAIRIDGGKINVKLITLNFKRYILYLGTQPKHEGVGVDCKPSGVSSGSKRRHVWAQGWCDVVEKEINGIINDADVPRFQGGLRPFRRVIQDPFFTRFQTKVCGPVALYWEGHRPRWACLDWVDKGRSSGLPSLQMKHVEAPSGAGTGRAASGGLLCWGKRTLRRMSALHWHKLLPLQNAFRSIVSFYSHFKPVRLGGQVLFS